METTLKVIVRIVSTNEDIDVDLPANATAADVIESLLEANIFPRNDQQGNHVTYQLTPKGKGLIIGEDETLAEAKVQQGDVLLVTPVLIVG
jgi:uncharacterized ubiquitin-like protein YukD